MSIYTHICVYQTYISTYMLISVHIYTYLFIIYISCISGPGPIAGTNLTGTNLRDQAEIHICAYV